MDNEDIERRRMENWYREHYKGGSVSWARVPDDSRYQCEFCNFAWAAWKAAIEPFTRDIP